MRSAQQRLLVASAGPLLLAVCTLSVIGLERSYGLWALSDDDYARLVIAIGQAELPRFDPSRTSWLPFPFWLYGAAVSLGGHVGLAPLDAARALPWLLSTLSIELVYASARLLGLPAGRATLSALIALGASQVALLSGMCVPELPTAALMCFALCARGSLRGADGAEPRSPLLGSAASLAATLAALSRYEAWPGAFIVALFALVRARTPRWRRALEVTLALVGPVWWLVHNAALHGDALHFLARVSAYSASLPGRASSIEVVVGYLRALALESPVITLAFGVVALLVLAGRVKLLHPERYGPALLGALASTAFLLVGALLGGVPTHHPERTLLVCWLLAATFIAHTWRLAAPLALIGLCSLPFTLPKTDGFSRAEHEQLGRSLRTLLAPRERALLSTPDLGYHALLASVGRLAPLQVDQAHDPRVPDRVSRFRTTADLERLRTEKIRYVVAPEASWASRHVVERTARLVLYDLTR